MLWGCFAAGGTGALHKIDGIMRMKNYVDILKLGRKWFFQMDKVVAKWLKDNKVKVLEWASQSPDLNPITVVGRTEKACASKKDSVTPALSGEMGQNSPNLLWEACRRLPETFDPS